MVRVDRTLSKIYRRLGYKVALYPKYFIIGSFLAALSLGSGLLFVNYENDFHDLYSVKNGKRITEEERIRKLFPTNYTNNFSVSRITQHGRIARIIVTAQDGEGLLRENIWKEISQLDYLMHAVSFKDGGTTYNYSALCAMEKSDTCYENKIMDIVNLMHRIENGTFKLSYPITVNPETYDAYIIPLYFGGIKLNTHKSVVLDAEALSLQYFLNSQDDEKYAMGKLWERAVVKVLSEYDTKWKYINVFRLTYDAYITEQEDNVLSAIPYTSVTIFLVHVFVVLSTLSRDWVRAKPFVGIAGIIGSGLGSLAGFGFLGYAGVTLSSLNIIIPFLMIGIGIDDTFVLLSAWRKTHLTDPVPDRLAETYADAAVSITITSLTDMLSFYVGVLTPISSIQIFCAYAGTCVFFILLFQLTFFGAVLGLSGYLEADNKHAVFWWITATPKSKSAGMGKIKRLLFTGGIDKDCPNNPIDNQDSIAMAFFRDSYSKFLTKKSTLFLIVVMYALYIGASVSGLLQLEEELKGEDLFKHDSYLGKFLIKDFQYFRQRGHRMQITIASPLNYSDPNTQFRIDEILEAFGNSSRFAAREFRENWLQGFNQYVNDYGEFFDFNITNENEFISTLREYYFPNNIYATDVKFNENGTQITASRFIIQLYDTKTNLESVEAITKMRKVAESIHDMDVFVYNPTLVFLDQFIYTRSLTIQLLSIAATIAMLVVVIFIPDIPTSICVFFTICSTELGVIGIMSLWGVNLNILSILCLIMCIGFSVDFSAHVSYSYISSTGTPEERIQKAMYSLGLPILQGGLSTVLALVVLNFVPSAFTIIFFKVVTLVIIIAGFHGLLILPAAFLVIKPEQLLGKPELDSDSMCKETI